MLSASTTLLRNRRAVLGSRATSLWRAFSASADGAPLFDKILIANRGEIACRVARSARKLGIKTVAIYSDPDASALHVREADEAVCVGPAASDASYLNIPAIVDAVKSTGAQAVHPGYGFLSENYAFAHALQEHGVKFIGPGEFAIDKMGDKIESKLIAVAAGVNTVPGHAGVVDTDEEVLKACNQVGYPVMIKASAGGGGKGMRIAWNDEEAKMGFRLSKDEAKSSFGDDRIFIEKFIEDPRHIEIQILADSHGNVVAFPERECSIQRRNQKVIEESPSMLLDDKTRAAMGEQACMLARAVDYQSAGTVEFLCDKHKNFYFLEMNTRLQVEHPVTESITGVDLVEQMIRVAAGLPLPDELLGGIVPFKGWSFEARVYAEDPLRNFMPSTGTLSRYIEPPKAPSGFVGKGAEAASVGEGVRVDAGVREGSTISMFYDPMICKLVTYGETRNEALNRLTDSLDKYVIHGVNHNVAFLRDLCVHPRFVEGALTTGFIEEEYPEGFHGVSIDHEDRLYLAASAAVMDAIKIKHSTSATTFKPRVITLAPHTEEQLKVTAQVTLDGDNWSVDVDGKTFNFDNFGWPLHAPVLETTVGSESTTIQLLESLPEGYLLKMKGAVQEVAVRSARHAELADHMPPPVVRDTSNMLVSPMPGILVSVAVEVGQHVEVGQELAVVEAMKMANVLRSDKKGIVKSIPNPAGATLAVDDMIIEFEADEEEAEE